MQDKIEEKITIYTDGSSRGNPGPGGWGAIIIFNSKIKEIGGREEKTTNNRMELRAAIESLKIISENNIEMHTDSEYLMKGATVWINNWKKNGWKTKNKKPVLNQDMWEELSSQIQNKSIKWVKVLGHSGHKFNDRCDEIATSFADGKKVALYDGSIEDYKI